MLRLMKFDSSVSPTLPLIPTLDPQLIQSCSYCAALSDEPGCKTPIACTKLSGSCQPIRVNLATCFTCGEYRKPSREPDNAEATYTQ